MIEDKCVEICRGYRPDVTDFWGRYVGLALAITSTLAIGENISFIEHEQKLTSIG